MTHQAPSGDDDSVGYGGRRHQPGKKHIVRATCASLPRAGWAGPPPSPWSPIQQSPGTGRLRSFSGENPETLTFFKQMVAGERGLPSIA